MAAGCKKFEEFQIDPNYSTIATPDLLLNSVEQNAFEVLDLSATLATRQMVFNNSVSNEQYYGWARASFNPYSQLLQVEKMEQEANRMGKPEYIPLVKFFNAWYFLQLTNTFGDIPYSEAMKGDEGNGAPVYDKQEDIFLSILNDLDEANKLITSSTASVQGDIVYKGEMTKWKQLINTLSLRVLISLSQKGNNTKIEVKKRFAAIVNDPTTYPLLTGNGDNGQLTFYDLQDNRYKHYNSNDLQTAYYMEETFMDLLKGLKDPRLFAFAEKAPKYAALPDNDFNAYGGVKGSASLDKNSVRILAGEASRIKKRYYNNPVNEPSVALGYPELQFILAEGVIRGWISGSAADYYNKGVTASMQFYGIAQAEITAYLQLNPYPAVNSLETVMTQKYLASFLSGGWQFFYEQRRTGLPVFDVSGDGVLNNKKVPARWMYPETELQNNQQHVNEAISRQYPEGDNINGVMWLLKAE
ncbi:Starch-binding associating with outer membrane [Chitinophaga sp. CF118]|nr:Starch-binding associating with outer membrane [Chitinophaga sp. CF118]